MRQPSLRGLRAGTPRRQWLVSRRVRRETYSMTGESSGITPFILRSILYLKFGFLDTTRCDCSSLRTPFRLSFVVRPLLRPGGCVRHSRDLRTVAHPPTFAQGSSIQPLVWRTCSTPSPSSSSSLLLVRGASIVLSTMLTLRSCLLYSASLDSPLTDS